jgi:hypothetical protein
MVDSTVVVKYDRTDYGRIYLGDVGQRHQLGGGKGLYTSGQDRYISYGQDATFVKTGDVLLSVDRGRIHKLYQHGDKTAFTVLFA